MTALLKNLWTLLRPVSRKEIDKINHELQAIHNRRFGTVYSKRVEIDLSKYRKPTIRGEQVTKVRADMGLNQTDFGKMIGVAATTVSTWETSKVMPEEYHLKRLTQITGKRKSYFLRG